MSKTQVVGLAAAAAAAYGLYFKSKFDAAKEVGVPPNSLLARVMPPPTSGIKASTVFRDCFRLTWPAQELPVLMSNGGAGPVSTNAAAMEYARAVFLSKGFATQRRLALSSAEFGEGLDDKSLATTDFPVGYKAGSFQVAEVAPGEILFRFVFPNTPMAGAMWLAVRLPPEAALGPALSGPPKLGAPTPVSNPVAAADHAGEGSGEVEFMFGTALWEEGAEGEGVPEHMTSGVGGTLHRWYSQILVWTAVQRLRKLKPSAGVDV